MVRLGLGHLKPFCFSSVHSEPLDKILHLTSFGCANGARIEEGPIKSVFIFCQILFSVFDFFFLDSVLSI